MFPTVKYPVYELELHDGKRIRFKPFTVTEEKILLMAKQGGDEKEMENAIKQAVQSSVLDGIDIETLPLFDVEYIFIQARGKSVGDEVLMLFKGDEESTCEHCRKVKDARIKVSDIKIEQTPNHTTKIQLSGDLGIQMKYPTVSLWKDIENLESEKNDALVFTTIGKCVAYVFDKENVYESEDINETIKFLDSLMPKDFKKILEFFMTMPQVKHRIHFECPECKTKSYYDFAGLESFFG